jgi:FecR protein
MASDMHCLFHKFVSNQVEVFMKLKFIAALLGLGLVVAIPGAVIAQNPAQNPADQTTDPYSKPSPNVQAPAPGPNDQGPADQNSMDQDQDSMNPSSASPNSANQGPIDPGPNDASGNAPTSNSPAPVENNGVARVSLIHGDVSTQRGDSKDWSAAALNAPLVAGDRVSTGDKARTEIQLDYANMLRLAEHSQANLTQLTHSQIQIQLGHGMANYTVLRNSDADAEIDTPNVAIRTEKRESSFRILVTADDHTEVLVRKGEIEVTTPQGGTRVGQNQFITIQGSGADAQYKIGEAPARDDFDQWNSDRDNMIRNSVARKHTNDYYVGTEDLDSHGAWSEVPDYGQVWRPNEPAGWAPYRDGRWVYEPYWGWTWVSSDSWGWAPYHYGRWMYVNGGWGWWPGPAYGYPFYRPIWAPAYVSFFGFGGGFGFGVGGWGGIGWLPLGPCDFFHPWWGRWGGGRFGSVGFRDYNRGGFAPLHGGNRFSNVNLARNDRNFRGGTTVSGRDFGTGHMRATAMSHAQFQNASFSTGRLPVTPSRESFSASGRAAAASTTRNVSQNQHFFSNRGATAGGSNARSTFARETGRVGNGSSNGGIQRSSQSNERGSETRSNSNLGTESRPGNSSGARGSSGGWQKFSSMPARSASESERASESSRMGESGRTNQSSGRESQSRESMSRSESRSPYGSSSSGPSRSMGPTSRSYGGSSRPPLNMRQPIVTPRSYGGGRSAPGYSGRPAPSYGGHSAPSYGGGGHSAPSHGGGGGAPHGGGGGGGSHSGGGSHGGGGRHGR